MSKLIHSIAISLVLYVAAPCLSQETRSTQTYVLQTSAAQTSALETAAAKVAPSNKAAMPASVVVFHNVRVFDGTRLLPGAQTVVVRNGKIAAIGPVASVAIPAEAANAMTRFEGAGTATLLPGLIDAHTHAYADALTQALMFGVTTELDMFSDFHMAATMRAEQTSGKGLDRADLFSAGILATAPGGHGTEYGFPIPTLTRPEEAQAFVDARIAEGSDYIKIVIDDGSTYGGHTPTLDAATVKALTAAAHKRHKLAVVHVGSYADAREAIEAGADGLAHLFVDRAPDADFGRFVASHHAFVVPTLDVLLSISGGGPATGTGSTPAARAMGVSLSKEGTPFASYLTAEQIANLAHTFPHNPRGPQLSYEAARVSVQLLKAAHVPLLAGTDAPNPGTTHGTSLHHEMELLVDAGLTPTEALAAATSIPAAQFHLKDRGRIALGMRADLLLVQGDPTSDIHATRQIVGVWKQGVAADRAGYLAARNAERAAKSVIAAAEAADKGNKSDVNGLVSDFDDGKVAAKFGAGWSLSTDSIAGGKSQSSMAVVPGGAQGTPFALSVTGTVDGGLPYAWAGVLFSPGPAIFAPFDLSARKELHFWAKGDGRTYEVMFFAQSKGQQPLIKTFTPGAAWKEFVFKLADFDGIDGHDVMAVVFAAGPQPGTFALQLDSIRFR